MAAGVAYLYLRQPLQTHWRWRSFPEAVVLFLFEFLFFAVALGVVIVAEVSGRDTAVIGGLALTLCSIVAQVVVGRRVPLPAGRDRAAFHAAPDEARWWRATLDSWWHFNRALLIGSVVLLLWAGAARLLHL